MIVCYQRCTSVSCRVMFFTLMVFIHTFQLQNNNYHTEDFHAQLVAANQNFHALTTTAALHTQSLAVLDVSVKDITTQLRDANDRMSTIERNVSNHGVHIQHLNQNVQIITDQLFGIYNKTLPVIQSTQSVNNEHIAQLQVKVIDIETSRTERETKLQTQLTSLAEAASKQDTKSTALATSLQTLKTDFNARVNELSKDSTEKVDSLNKQASDLTITTSEHANTLKTIITTMSTLTNNVATLKDTQLITTEKLNRLEGQETKFEAYRTAQTEINNANNALIQQLHTKLELQNAQIAALLELQKKQSTEIISLQEENKRLFRETASLETVDSLRKLLYDMQGSMIGHSAKVLDLILANSGGSSSASGQKKHETSNA